MVANMNVTSCRGGARWHWLWEVPRAVPRGGWGFWLGLYAKDFTSDGTEQSLVYCGRRPRFVSFGHSGLYRLRYPDCTHATFAAPGDRWVLSPIAIAASCIPGRRLTAFYGDVELPL